MKKTGVSRKGLLTDDTKELLMQKQRVELKGGADKVFDLKADTMKKRINRYLAKLGFKHTSHDFRHTKITELADAGLATKTMQMYVGHKNPATTMRYIHVEEDEALH